MSDTICVTGTLTITDHADGLVEIETTDALDLRTPIAITVKETYADVVNGCLLITVKLAFGPAPVYRTETLSEAERNPGMANQL